MGEAARRHAHDNFSNDKFISGFIDAFNQIKSRRSDKELKSPQVAR
jgi:hypothetical protein